MITLTTAVYDKNINDIGWFLEFDHPLVTEKLIIVNNLTDWNTLPKQPNVRVIFSKDYEQEVNKYFKLNMNPRVTGYYYSIHHFVALLESRGDYILSISSDSFEKYNDTFIEEGIKALDDQDTLAKIHGTGTRVFCDNVWFANKDKLKDIDFNTKFEGDFTPHYGGESFEKRISCYLHNTNFVLSI